MPRKMPNPLKERFPQLAETIPEDVHECFITPMQSFWDMTSDEYNYCSEIFASTDKQDANITHYHYCRQHLVVGMIEVPTPKGTWFIVYGLDP